MSTFKCSKFVIIKHLFYSVFGGAALAFILSIFLSQDGNYTIPIVVGVLAMLFMIFSTLVSDNILIEVDENNDRLTFFKRKKIKHQFTMSEVGFYAKIKTTSGDSDCTLTVVESNGNKTYIDCTLLGASRFYKLLDVLKVTDPEPIEVKTTKKN